MLRHLDGPPAPELVALLDGQPELSVRIRALWRAYGAGQNFFDVWVQDEARACLARLDDTFFLVDGGADYEEIASFLHMAPYFTALIAADRAARSVADRLPAPVAISGRGGSLAFLSFHVTRLSSASFRHPSFSQVSL